MLQVLLLVPVDLSVTVVSRSPVALPERISTIDAVLTGRVVGRAAGEAEPDLLVHVAEGVPAVERDPVTGRRLPRCRPPPVGSFVVAVFVPDCSITNSTCWRRMLTTFWSIAVSAGWPFAPRSVYDALIAAAIEPPWLMSSGLVAKKPEQPVFDSPA